MDKLTLRVKARLDAGLLTKMDLAGQLGISRATLDTRLKKSNWKKSELYLLNLIFV